MMNVSFIHLDISGTLTLASLKVKSMVIQNSCMIILLAVLY